MAAAPVKAAVRAVAMRPLPSSGTLGPRLDRKCESCAVEDERKLIQRSPERSSQNASSHAWMVPAHSLSQLAIVPAAPHDTLAVSEPEDASEREADQMAERVRARLSSDAPPPDPPPRLSGPTGERLQRAVAEDELASPAAGGFLVDDEVATLLPGQMRKSDFLVALRTPLCDAANRELAAVGRDTEGCPYLEDMFSYYANHDARHGERALRKYAPETARARSAAEYIPPLSARVAQGVRHWVATGAAPELPEGLTSEMLAGGGGLLGALAGLGTSIGGAITGGLSAIGGLFFRSESGGARSGVDRSSLRARLDTGQPLAVETQSRMGAAFGHDFSAVRIHADGEAAKTAQALNAQAFTLGTHVAFAPGHYHPGDPVGDALLAHELAHVVQQGGARTPAPEVARPDDALEDDADAAAAGALVSLWKPSIEDSALSERERIAYEAARDPKRENKPRRRAGLALQRCSPERCSNKGPSKVAPVGQKVEPRATAPEADAGAGQAPAQPPCKTDKRPDTMPGHTSEVSAPSGEPDTRSTVGVGEKLKFWSDGPGRWTADSTGPGGTTTANGTEFCWIAPAVAGTATITFHPDRGGTAKTFAIRVIAPTVAYQKKPGEVPDEISDLPAGTAGAGMKLTVSFKPDTVSFQGVRWLEGRAAASDQKGYFEGRAVKEHTPTSDALTKMDESNTGVEDKAAFWGFEPPWRKGSFTWAIPTSYRVSGDENRLIRNVDQKTEVDGPTGCTTVTKDAEKSDPRCP